MIKGNTIWLQLTRNEANAIMVMLDSEIENTYEVCGIDLSMIGKPRPRSIQAAGFRYFQEMVMGELR